MPTSFIIKDISKNYDKHTTISINNRIVFSIDCSGSMCCSESTLGDRINLSTVTKILNSIITDIEYEDAYCAGMTWKMPIYIVFEKNGWQLKLNKNGEKITYLISKVKYNKSIKHTHKFLVNEPNVVESI
ncbi:MAG: hypothetical protein PHG66_01800 [Candidatus Colwellbacteria bacterium]|nr:hypothetical protein [Candidatus Colwellbacteria bacterium]